MNEFVFYVVVIALLAAFIIMLLRKWGVIEWVQINGNEFFSKMFSCDFCLSWWAAVILSFIATIFTGNISLFLVPFCSTMITRILL